MCDTNTNDFIDNEAAQATTKEDPMGEDTAKKTKRDAVKSLFRIQRYMTLGRPHPHRGGKGPHQGEFDPYRGQGRVLSLLALKPEMSQREMAHILDMRRQSLGELLAKLERDGMIEREQSAEDRRMMVVRLTEQGQAEAKKVGSGRGKLHAAMDALTEEEQAKLSEYLNRLADAYLDAMPKELSDRIREHEEMRSKMTFKDAAQFMGEFRDELRDGPAGDWQDGGFEGHGPCHGRGRHGHGRGGHFGHEGHGECCHGGHGYGRGMHGHGRGGHGDHDHGCGRHGEPGERE
jgi:DNA-binding MarR family transcriptional regulator